MKMTSSRILRIGLAVTFIWIGLLIMKSPEAWASGIAPWARALIPGSIVMAMQATALLDVAVGALFLIDVWVWLAALIGAIHIAIVLITVGVTDITVRDIGLLAGTLALLEDFWPSFLMKRAQPVAKSK